MLAKRIGVSFLSVGSGFLLGTGGMAIGGAIGTAICPVVGTIIGSIIGAIAGATVNYFCSQGYTQLVDKIWDTSKDEEILAKRQMYHKSLKLLHA